MNDDRIEHIINAAIKKCIFENDDESVLEKERGGILYGDTKFETLTGKMDTKDDIYGFSPSFKQLPRKHGHAKNGFVLKGEPKFVIKGLKMPPRPYFNYQISAKKAHKKLPDNRSLLKVYDAVIISLPPRKKLMRAMLGIEMDLDGTRIARVLQGVDREIQQRLGGEATEGGSDWYDADAFELLAAMVSELNKLPSEGTVDETAPAGTGPSPMELDFSNAGDLFWNKPAVKMYFYNNAFNQLVDLYDPSDLLCLPKDSILGLLRFAMKNPIPLAMEPRIPFRCVNTIGVKKKGRATGWKLPELSYQKLHKTIKKFGADTIPEDTASVLLYNIMKRNFSDGKNTATGAEALKRDLIRNKKISGAEVFEAAVGALVQHGMIVDMRKLAPGADQGVWRDGYLYLANIYAFEKSICAAMVSVCETNVRESTANQEDWKRARGPELQLASAMCDEQWKAMRLFAASPLLYVGGGAGSGKTYFLSRVASLYPGPKVLALAFMNTAVSLLNRNVAPGRSMSCHAFITAHGLECPHSPFRDSPHPGGKCIAKGVEVLVIDEFSVMYAELLAMTLHIFRRCGSLRKVVFTGDHRQLPPIQGGDLLRDFRDGVPWAVVDFTHNHRVSDANFTTIAWNATCIDSGHYGALKTTPFGVGKDHEPVLLLEPDGDGAGCERALVGVLESLQLGEYDHHVITPTNKLRKSLNYVVEQHYLGSQPVENVFHVGRKFVFKMNVPKKNIANNEIMVLDAVWDQHMDTLREDPKNIPPRPLLGAGQSARLAGTLGAQACKGVIHRDSTEPPVPRDYARFIACHSLLGRERVGERIYNMADLLAQDKKKKKWQIMMKASVTTNHGFQGSQIKCIIFVTDRAGGSFDTREMLYTASTRAEEKVIYICSKLSLKWMFGNKETHRTTGMKDMLHANLERYKNYFSLENIDQAFPL